MMMRIVMRLALVAATLAWGATPVVAQVRNVDPNSAIDADLSPRTTTAPQNSQTVDPGPQTIPPPSSQDAIATGQYGTPAAPQNGAAPLPPMPEGAPAYANADSSTYKRDDLIAAAEGVFGQGAAGIAGMVEKLLKEQGEPNAYITGREASAAFGIGIRYGSGSMSHKVEGKRDVYWTGPSLGFDVGGDAAKVFVLVYNLYDTQDIYKRFPAVEGRAYLVGGLAATYLRRGNIVLIPIRLGVGWRLGANIGYMKITEKSKWLPF